MRLLFRGAYLLVHLSLLGVFAAGLAARHIHPQTAWWLQPVAVVLPVIAAEVVVDTLASALLGRWLLFAASLVLLAVFAYRYVEVLGGSVNGTGDTLTVVTLNSAGGVHNLEGGDRGIPEIIRAMEPDIFCLQEFTVDYRGNEARTYGYVDALLEVEGYEIVAPERLEGHRKPAPVVTRLGFDQSSIIGLAGSQLLGPAGTLVRAQLRWDGRPIVVYNVHLQGYTRNRPWSNGHLFSIRAWLSFLRRSGASFIQRAAEAENIKTLMDQEEHPVLLCGDFNTTPHQWVHGRLSRGFQDVYRSSGGLWGPTFPSRRPLVRIDYMMASEHWKVVESMVGPRLPSDHRPVIARLRLRDAR